MNMVFIPYVYFLNGNLPSSVNSLEPVAEQIEVGG